MKITIISIGKIKKEFFKDAIIEYKKRLQKFCDLNIIELKEEKFEDDNITSINIAKSNEAIRIIAEIKKEKAYVISLCIEGKQLSTKDLAEKVIEIQNNRYSHIIFIIGSSYGLDKKIYDLSDLKLSFSKLTFPHQLFRVILLEQIYRVFKILNNETYHK